MAVKRKIRWAIVTTLVLLAGLIAVALSRVADSKSGRHSLMSTVSCIVRVGGEGITDRADEAD